MKLNSKSWVKMQACLDLTRMRIMLLGVLLLSSTYRSLVLGGGLYFPPAGKNIENQDRKTPQEVGLNPAVAQRINEYISKNPYQRAREKPRWALWRHGRLVCVEGDFHKITDVASLRKTWHAMIVGAAIKQGKIPSLQQRISTWLPELKGNDAEATWWHVITQSAGFDYPYSDYPDYKPGQMWTYSDWNLVHLCNALAKVYRKNNFNDDFADVASEAYFDAIGMDGWSTAIKKDGGFGNRSDGVRFVISIEHMGRLGLLALARGSWNGVELVPKWFVEQLESKQTSGMLVNYNGPNDGRIGLSPEKFPECPYGYLTWVNTNRDLFEGADNAWACGRGAGGTMILWNHRNGIVFAGVTVTASSGANSVAHVIESCIIGSNPLARGPEITTVGQWDRYEAFVTNTQSYQDPYRDTTLNVTYIRPDNNKIQFWGFYDGGTTWMMRFMPNLLGTWKYNATFSDGQPGKSGSFNCVPSNLPGMISQDEVNPIWFGYKGGNHMIMRSFHVGDRFFAANWPTSSRKTFLDWIQKQGYNTLSIGSHYLNRDADTRGRGWDTPDLWDNESRKLKEAEYDEMEVILDDLEKRRIIVHPFGGFLGANSDYPKDSSDRTLYIKYTLARLGSYWNVMLNVAGPELAKWKLSESEVATIGKEIQSLDVFGHLLACHQTSNKNFFKDQSWNNYDCYQGTKTHDLNKLYTELSQTFRSSGEPFYAHETLWSGNKNHPGYSDTQLRKNAIVINMAAAALNFGDMNGNSSSGFSGSLDLGDLRQVRHDIVKRVWDFFETIEFWKMSPRPDLTSNGYCLAKVGEEYLVYRPGKGSITVNITGGSYHVTWINAQNTSERINGGITTNGQKLSTPGHGDDWFCHLTQDKPDH
jgi:CubicO group peptidase (beta-lactamase class C family)